MKILRTLLWKEWRDHRALILVSGLLMSALLAGAEALYGPAFDADLRVKRFLPIVWLLFLMALAADVACRDHQSGASEALGRLPMVQRLVWLTRAAFVIVMGTLALAFLTLLEMGVQSWEGVDPQGFEHLFDPFVLWGAALVVLGVLGAGGLLRRPLPAALLGIAVPVGVPLMVRFLPRTPLADWTWLTVGAWKWGPLGVGLFLGAALTCAALAGHTPWRRRRPVEVALALGGLLVVLAPAGIASGVRVWSRTDIVPHAVGVDVMHSEPSPDGRHVALMVWRDLPTDREWAGKNRQHGLFRSEVWILDRATGRAAQIDERVRQLYRPLRYRWDESAWGSDGLLHTLSNAGPAIDSGPRTLEVIDPSSMQVVLRVPETEVAHFEHERGLEAWYERERDGERRTLRWRGREVAFTLDGHDVVPTPLPGFVLFARDGRLIRRDLLTGTERDLAATTDTWHLNQSPDGRHVAVRERDEEGYRVIEVERGAQLASGVYPHWSPGEEHVLIWRSRVLRGDGTWRDLPDCEYAGPFDARHAIRTPGGTWSNWKDRLELVDLETGSVTPLYGLD